MPDSLVSTPALNRLVARLTDVLERRTEVLDAYLFGSLARGDGHAGSDVDVAVYIDEACAESGAWGYRADLTTDLMGALNTNDVDVVVLNQAPAGIVYGAWNAVCGYRHKAPWMSQAIYVRPSVRLRLPTEMRSTV